MRSPFQADVSPMPMALDHPEQELVMAHDEPTFQMDPHENIVQVVEPQQADPFKAIRDFVKKPRVSVKEVHQIMNKQSRFKASKSRQTLNPSLAYQKAMNTIYSGNSSLAARSSLPINRINT